jgi:hypothetical protein
MRTIQGGGPAFPASIPVVHSDEQGKDYPCYEEAGMSLRDYFAGQALIGEMQRHGEDLEWVPRAGLIAKACYAVADAMLDERTK